MTLDDQRSFRLEEGTDEEPQMLMTSMIDVIFIVLAFFICVTEIKKGSLDVDVPQVPQVSQESDEASAEPILIEVSADDQVYVSGERAADDEALAQLITAAVATHGVDAPVQIQGDRQARNGTMMRVISQLSAAGLKRIVFAVEAGG